MQVMMDRWTVLACSGMGAHERDAYTVKLVS